ncbi:MAG: hypothetical protein OIN66_18560 [Candidatus Methanoperedens sp.]|nr:hypothetical protein [Candidatus Methanoperedens sp.]
MRIEFSFRYGFAAGSRNFPPAALDIINSFVFKEPLLPPERK